MSASSAHDRTHVVGPDAVTVKTHARRRRYDPDRRQRIAEAATTLITRDGPFALTHRAVAAEAGVPLGSTTYHFVDLDALLSAALERITDDELTVLERWSRDWDLTRRLEDALVSLVLYYTNEERERTTVEYELHMLAYRRASMRSLGKRWEETFAAILGQVLAEHDVEVVIASFDAIMLHGLGREGLLSEEWARDYLRRVLPRSRVGCVLGTL